jgi:hypothetical protein
MYELNTVVNYRCVISNNKTTFIVTIPVRVTSGACCTVGVWFTTSSFAASPVGDILVKSEESIRTMTNELFIEELMVEPSTNASFLNNEN